MQLRRLLFASSMILAVSVGARAQAPWPDTYLGRVEAMAVIQSLNARLLASRSATATLEGWCAEHGMAEAPRLSARLLREVHKPATEETRRRLQVGPDAELRYRRVRLACGDHVLSEADNWYVPERLTPEMNRLLDTTDTPFGRAVQALAPTRQTVSADLHWQILPLGWEQAPVPSPVCTALAIPGSLFSHRAILFGADRLPFSEVVETYTGSILDFRRPDRPNDPACGAVSHPVSRGPGTAP